MSQFSLTTLCLAAVAGAAGLAGFPLVWSVVNCAIAATLAGMLIARQKFSGIDLARTLKITLAALAGNAIVAVLAFYAGEALRAVIGAFGG